MFNQSSLKIALFISVAALVGCESTGSIHGVNSDGRGVQFDYNQGFLENSGTLKITLPDGESFRGKFIQQSASTSGDEWEIGESSKDDSLTFRSSETLSSATDAVLIGNRGNTMKCKFQLSTPRFGIEGGGVGQCKTSTRQSITVTF